MEKITEKINIFLEALKTLEEGIELFCKYENLLDKKPTDENEQLFKSMRDSVIQRFEYCTDLFWKLVKVYLESEGIALSINSPKFILREAVKVRILSEVEGDECMDMIDSRNKTSHTYHEVLAEEIAHEIPGYYELMKEVVDRMQGMIAQK